MAANYRRTIYQATGWQGLVLIGYSITLMAESESFSRLAKDNAHCYVFILSNVCLYLIGIIYNIIALIFSRYYKFFIKGAYLLQLFLVSYSIYGIVILR